MTTEQMIELYLGTNNQTDFTANTWGNPLGKIKYPPSFVKRWTIKTNDKGELIFDEARAFKELAAMAIIYLRRNYKILRELGGRFQILPQDMKDNFKTVIYKLMADLVMNRNIWLKTNTTAISIPNFSLSPESNSWILPIDVINMYVEASAYDMGLNDLEIIEIDDGELAMLKENGDQVIIGKWDDITNVDDVLILEILKAPELTPEQRLNKIKEVING